MKRDIEKIKDDLLGARQNLIDLLYAKIEILEEFAILQKEIIEILQKREKEYINNERIK